MTGRPTMALGRLGVRTAAPLLALTLLSAAGLAYFLLTDTRANQRETVDSYAKLVARLVTGQLRDAMQRRDLDALERQIRRVAEEEPIRGVRLLDRTGKVVFASDHLEVGESAGLEEPTCQACHDVAPPRPEGTARLSLRGVEVLRSARAIRVEPECTECHDAPLGTAIGVIVTDLDEDLLTGSFSRRTRHTVWLAAGMALLFGILTLRAGRRVATRLKDLFRLLETLRGGARAIVSRSVNKDEVDELARSLEAFALDLDERVFVEKTASALEHTLDRFPGAVLFLDPRGYAFLANCRASVKIAGSQSAVGRPRADLDHPTMELVREAEESGFSSTQSGGPFVAGFVDSRGERVGFIEAWPDEPETEAVVPSRRDRTWIMYAAALLGRARGLAKGRGGVIPFDRRLGPMTRLIHELAKATAAASDRAEIDLAALLAVVEQDVRRDFRDREWRTLNTCAPTAVADRHQVRELMSRLLRAAAIQAGTGGRVVAFARLDPAVGKVFLGGWASVRGGETPVDSPSGPPVGAALAAALGGAMEVDPAYDVRPLIEASQITWEGDPVGSLFVAEIEGSGRA